MTGCRAGEVPFASSAIAARRRWVVGCPPADGAGDAAVLDSACSVSRVLLGLAFVAAPIVAGEAGHQLLGILTFDALKKLGRATSAKGGCRATVVTDDDIVTANQVRETLRRRHGANLEDPTANGFRARPENVPIR